MIPSERQRRWKILREEVSGMGNFCAVVQMIFFPIYLLVLVIAGTQLTHFPQDLGFRDFYIGDLAVCLCVFPVGTFFEVAEKYSWFEDKLSKKLAVSTSLLMIGVHFYYSFNILENIDVVTTIKNLKASNDSDAVLLTTYILSAYDSCCFLNESAPPLDCESRNFEYPCYEDIALFTEFQEDMLENCDYLAFVNPEKSNSDDYNQDGKHLRGNCENDLEEFVKNIGKSTYGILRSLSIFAFVIGLLSLSFASECTITLIG